MSYVTRQFKNKDIWNFSLNELLIIAQIVFSTSKNAYSFHIKCLKNTADFNINMQQKIKYATFKWTGQAKNLWISLDWVPILVKAVWIVWVNSIAWFLEKVKAQSINFLYL